MPKVVVALSLVTFLLGAGCQQSTTTNPASTIAEPNTVTLENYQFGPETLTVKVGTTVQWVNKDTAGHTITIDAGDSGPDSELIAKNGKFSHAFTTAGTYAYHCSPHPYMKGKIIVTE